MIARVLIVALTLLTAAVECRPQGVASPVGRGQVQWLRTESRHFEIHYPSALAVDVDRVVRSAERAWALVSERLASKFAKKVPLVVSVPSGPLTRDEVVAYAVSDDVAPQQPHRSRIVVPLPDRDGDLDALLVHELTHLLVGEIILPEQPGDGGLPRWVQEGIARHMVGTWSDDDERLMRDVVATRRVPDLSRLTQQAGASDPRVDDVLGHAAFDYIASRWGVPSIPNFVNALIVPRVDRTYDAVFELTPAEFDAAFRRYAEHRFSPLVR